ncbi:MULTISPECIES: DUF6233 domain-containing protein [unclassified Streptomyces]|uniref:DUF6233 domain-containing protein n=1 Tax=unclassified Streptomyces TaxID=2593676 RepID=UPI00070F3541|nr:MULTISPECIES: DUF6233 domain-containing protein [unclassified Streptomyces]KRD21042.1 hypothetical protein ASE41_15855 [Streptomyces sp. Root264]
MSQLPPDPSRLRVILSHLERQMAEHETLAVYLRLQRDAVLAALARSERRPPRRTAPRAKGGGSLPGFTPPPAPGRDEGFVVQQKRTPDGPEPALIHLAECTMIEAASHRIRPDEARTALAVPNIEPCGFCRPDTALGIDVA